MVVMMMIKETNNWHYLPLAGKTLWLEEKGRFALCTAGWDDTLQWIQWWWWWWWRLWWWWWCRSAKRLSRSLTTSRRPHAPFALTGSTLDFIAFCTLSFEYCILNAAFWTLHIRYCTLNLAYCHYIVYWTLRIYYRGAAQMNGWVRRTLLSSLTIPSGRTHCSACNNCIFDICCICFN